MRRKVHVELLIGKPVIDPHGEIVGHIEEIRAEWSGNRCLVEEYHLGSGALLERLGISAAQLAGWPLAHHLLRVPWNLMDLSDPDHPRVTVPRAEIKQR